MCNGALDRQRIMKHFLAISILGEDRPGLIEAISGTILECGCDFGECRATVLGGAFTLQMLATGQWNTIAKLENALPLLAEEHALKLTTQRTEQRTDQAERLPYLVEVIALDKPGIVQGFAGFFARLDINIEELVTTNYQAAHTGAQMFTLSMTIGVPASHPIAELRETFLDHCDQQNLDGVIEPVKM